MVKLVQKAATEFKPLNDWSEEIKLLCQLIKTLQFVSSYSVLMFSDSPDGTEHFSPTWQY